MEKRILIKSTSSQTIWWSIRCWAMNG